jgi:Ca2+-binding RTX toxin-like protein
VAVYQFSTLSNGQAIAFDPNADLLYFDDSSLSASRLRFTVEGANLRVNVGTGKDVILLDTALQQLAPSNINFTNGLVLLGDNSPSQAGDNAANSLTGAAGNDFLGGFGGADTLNGGLGDDRYLVSTGDVLIDAGGNDMIVTDVTWHLAAGFEHLTATGTASTSHGGNNLNNSIAGNAGANWISGREGDDWLDGGAGGDTFNMSNGAGASYGNDTILGGDGADTLDYGAAARTAIVVAFGLDGLSGRASGGGTDGAGSVIFWDLENVNGSGFNDRISGNERANFFFGFNGNDTLDGGAGNDRLEGAAGNDQYVFSVAPGATNADTVVGFASGGDKLVLMNMPLGPNGNFAAGDARFAAGAGFNSGRDASDRVIYNTTTGQLWFDADGNGAGAAQLVATLQGAPAVVATDILVQSSTSAQTTNGTAGNDSLAGGVANDTINGLGGNDTLQGKDGDDRLDGGSGNDLLAGGNGADLMLGGDGNDTLDGATNSDGDRMWSGGEPTSGPTTTLPGDTLDGGLGDDAYYIQSNDSVTDAGGVDTIYTDQWSYTLGAGIENLTYESFWIYGDEGAFVWYTGNELDNVISGGGFASGSGAMLDGGDGNDTLYGSGSEVTFTFSAGSGDYGHDVVHGGNGMSSTIIAGAHSAIVAHLEAGTLVGGGTAGSGSATLFGVGNAIGGNFDDHLIGTPSGSGYFDYPFLEGGGGNDTLEGASSGTTYHLRGGEGNDRLISHAEDDWLTGGAGADQFVLSGGEGIFHDFASGTDKIVLDADDMSALGASGNFAAGDARFHAAAGAMGGHDADDRVIYDTSTRELFYDADGSGAGAAQFIGRLQEGASLSATDIAVENGGSSGGSTINGTAGNDSLVGTTGNDTINGLAGNDVIEAGAGADSISGGSGSDSMFAGVESMLGDGNTDTLDGGLGDDVYHNVSSYDHDVVLADPGGVDTVYAIGDWTLGDALENLRFEDRFGAAWSGVGNELGNTIVSASQGGEILGMGGNDLLVMGNPAGGYGFARGGEGNDTLEGARDSELFGDAGNDVLVAKYVGTTMTGGSGNDTFTLETVAFHQIQDFSGVDRIRLDASREMTALGASGNFAAGDPRFHAGAAVHDADDRIIWNSATGQLSYDPDGTGSQGGSLLATLQPGATLLATDIEVINGTAPAAGQTINGTTGNDSLTGTAGNDTINALAGEDRLDARLGNDSLSGSTGHDTLLGGDGHDTLNGGGWSDNLTGGAGADSFLYAEAGTNQTDQVTDFASGTDELLLENAYFTALGANSAWAAGDGRFWAAAGATSGHDTNDRIIYNTSTGALYYDADGSGAGAAQVVATFAGAPGISATDITVI